MLTLLTGFTMMELSGRGSGLRPANEEAPAGAGNTPGARASLKRRLADVHDDRPPPR